MTGVVLDPVRVPLTGTLLVEASAGTGKTWTIGALLLRFLLEEKLELPSLLVLTFTEAATAELRDRLRSRLEEARQALESDGEVEDHFLRDLREHLRGEGRWDHAEVLRRLRAALAAFDEASIFTIHGFCKRVLAERAVALGLPTEMELGEESSASLRQVGLDALRCQWQRFSPGLLDWLRAQGGLLEPTPWLKLATLGRRHPGATVPPVRELEPQLAALAPIEGDHARLAAQALALFDASGAGPLAELLTASSLNKNSYKPASLPKKLGLSRQWLEQGAPPQGCPEARRFTPVVLAGKVNKGGQAPKHAVFEALGALLDCEETVVAAYTGVLESLQHAALFQWPQQAADLRLKSRRLDFGDLLSLVADGLQGEGGEELARALRRRWSAALVDEFQDTDPLQAGIFQRVFQQAQLPLILVGDPKQAIYGFRGADLHAYLAAARCAGHRAGLHTNWRSGSRLITAVNRLFAQERHPVALGAFLRPDIVAAELQASGQVEERTLVLEGRPLAPFRVLQEMEEGLRRPEARRKVVRQLARLLARLLRPAPGDVTGWDGLRGLEPVQGRDVAVLVRSHSQGAQVAEALAEVGLACVHLSPQSVYQSSEAFDLQRLLLALARPHDTGRLRALLAGPFAFTLGVSPGEALRSQDAQERVQLALHGALQQAGREGTAPALRALVMELGLPEALLGLRRGERRLSNWLQLLELLPGLAPAGASPEELALQLEWSRDEPDTAAELRLESEENLVRVLTLHKSKGLEFPLVICPFLWDEGGHRESFGATLLHDAAGQARLRPWSKAQPLDEVERAGVQDEELAETMRLAYVGLTRARHHVLLYNVAPGVRSRKRPGALDWLLSSRHLSEDAAPGALESWKGLWSEGPARQLQEWKALALPGVLEVEELIPLPERQAPSRGEAADLPQEPPAFLGRIPEGPRLSSFSSLLLGAHANERLDEWPMPASEEDTTPGGPGDWRGRFPRGAAPGTCLHKLLELADFSPARDPLRLEALCRRELLAHGLDEALAPQTATWLGELLDAPLAASGFRLSDLTPAQRVAELEFHLHVRGLPAEDFRALLERHGLYSAERLGLQAPWPTAPPPTPGDLPAGYLKGYIDLIFEQDGRWWVLDWKSNHLGPNATVYSPRALGDEMARSGYFLQALLYLLALHRHLARTLPHYQADRHLGGLRYLFLRGVDTRQPGQGLWEDRPPLELILELDQRLGVVPCR